MRIAFASQRFGNTGFRYFELSMGLCAETNRAKAVHAKMAICQRKAKCGDDGLLRLLVLGYNVGFVFPEKGLTGGHARASIAQHAEWEDGIVRSAARGRSENVHMRADGIRLRAHRKFPDVRVSGHFATIFEAARVKADPCNESDGRG